MSKNDHSIERSDFSNIQTEISMPNLLQVQKQSYRDFLQMDIPSEERSGKEGLRAIFESIFPIEDYKGTCSVEFVEYSLGNWSCKCGELEGVEYLRIECEGCGNKIKASRDPGKYTLCSECGHKNYSLPPTCDVCEEAVDLRMKYDKNECKDRGMTYEIPLSVTLRLATYDTDTDSDTKELKDVKEETVYFGEIPFMSERGTFVMNGTERVIVSQLHRSPGIFFQEGKKSKDRYTAKMIPYRGSWVEMEYDARGRLKVSVDRKKKFFITVLLRALGLESDEEILRRFQNPQTLKIKEGKVFRPWNENVLGAKANETIRDSEDDIVIAEGEEYTEEILREMEKEEIEYIRLSPENYSEAVVLSDVVNEETGEIIIESNTTLNRKHIKELEEEGVEKLEVFFPGEDDTGEALSKTLEKDATSNREEGLIEIYRKMRPGDPPTLETSEKLFHKMFFDPQRYDLSRVGRLKFNTKLGGDDDLEERILKPEDFYRVVDYELKLRNGIGEVDDIDHLGNRRVRSVGELLENQFRIGLVRLERSLKEKMSTYKDIASAMPRELINAKPVIAAVREFFGRSQLSQFMDQTNPLAEITHKRRLSALGPGGLSRERAGFDVRDVHPTHYGRICPIETPEGPNIGLITSLSTYARINEFGFIETPYKKVEDGRVIDHVEIVSTGETDFEVGEIVERQEVEEINSKLKQGEKADFEPYVFYLSVWKEEKNIIGQACELDEDGYIKEPQIKAREGDDVVVVPREDLDYIDVSPKQLVSVSSSLIPFLENDDANRALMGSNMQRQAVPLMNTEAPVVGTGMEELAAKDSGSVVLCEREGVIDTVESERIIVRARKSEEDGEAPDFGADIYNLEKFNRSNQNTSVNHKPLVEEGEKVKKGDVLADGPATDKGELSLGRNVLVAFLPWRGYNFEDAVVVSEKLVKEDTYTSIHIEEFDTEARDTKLGPEEITSDIPNVSKEALKQLDESGIIQIGSKVSTGDILVGKVTPKGETKLSPEEKLLRAIFGEKARDIKDDSLKVPPGVEGTVVNAKVITRKGEEKDARTEKIQREKIEKFEKDKQDEIRIINEELKLKLAELLAGKKLSEGLKDSETGKSIFRKGRRPDKEELQELSLEELKRIEPEEDSEKIVREKKVLLQQAKDKREIVERAFQKKVEELEKGDDLQPGVIKKVKIHVAIKRKLSVGDKMAGRHGNKGVISKIVPEEDMPYLEDGTPVDVVLNPLGVPSRMNVGQIMETHLGWAAKEMDEHFATPVFDGATEEEIKDKLEEAGLPRDGKAVVYDGKTGEELDQNATVGYMYLMKLIHLADDKIHARSIGPYSLITQQPLGGKAQFGGQRLGEMEVWALEAYGAAHTLQEFLTAKSDDVYGRTKIYESLVKGEVASEPELPESFNVMVREMKSLGLDVELLTD